jgi:hypothetical protein
VASSKDGVRLVTLPKTKEAKINGRKIAITAK